MRQILKLHQDWPGPNGIIKSGDLRIPLDITLVLAKCARADGAGEIVEAEPFRSSKPARKTPAPENKLRGTAPETKSEMGKQDSGSGGERAESQPKPSRSRAKKRASVDRSQ